ncbi:MAG: sugar phosphate isomerase/epimerase [Cyclobacteriaceae bacterium]|nr:sugar phosphate isomerase/epimerase [Cyclobacteriaceae bacterium]
MHDLGFVSAILAESTFEEVVEFAAAHRFKCVEMMCWPKGKAERRYAGVTHIDVDSLDERQIQHIRTFLANHKVYISGLGYYPNPLDADRQRSDFYFDHLKKVVDAAVRLQIPVVNTFIGRDPSKNLAYNLDVFAERWPELIRYAGSHGIKVAIENCPMFFSDDEWPGGKNLATTPAVWDKMFEIIPDQNFGLNYDPSHMIWQHMDEIKPIYRYHERFHHVHLKDVKLDRDKLDMVGIMANPLEYHTPKLPGFGEVRWGQFFSALSESGYRGPVCIEVEDRAFENSIQDTKNAMLISRNYLSQYLVL